VTFLGRPRTATAAIAGETDRFSLTAMLSLAALCLVLGILPGLAIDWISPAAGQLVHGQMPQQRFLPWLTIIPIAQSRSSYNGLLVFLFIAASTCFAISAIHRFASHAMRRAPAWDCGTPNASPLTQYSAASFAQPIRRVFGAVVFRANERVSMPPPGSSRPATLDVELHDIPWEVLYSPIARAISYLTERLNALQFLTIRRYLTLVFFALVALLLGTAIWS
jgi:hypothetical protein